MLFRSVRAAQESIAYQVWDLVNAMEKDTGLGLTSLNADGGASRDRFLLQFQADILGRPVRRPVVRETTALGAAYLAGLAVDFWRDTEELRQLWREDAAFLPSMDPAPREDLLAGWHRAIEHGLGWVQH